MTVAGILQIVTLITRGLNAGLDALELARSARETLDLMIAENRDPSDEELDAVLGRIRERSARIQGV